MPTRILFLTLYPELAASPRYRVHQFLPALRAAGFDCTVASPITADAWQKLSGPGRTARPFWYHAHETPRRIAQLLSARNYDLIVVQKALATAPMRGLLAVLRASRRPWIYDVDDAMHLASPQPLRGPWRSIEAQDQIQNLARHACLVLAGNHWLVEQFSRLGATTTLFPTVVDTARFHPAPAPQQTFRAVWIGAPSTAPALELIVTPLQDTKDLELDIIGAPNPPLNHQSIRKLPWRFDEEVEAVQQAAFGIQPLPDTPWNRGKCALKLLICMACGLPCIASPVGPARTIIQHGVNGLLADGDHEWREALAHMRDPAARARMGTAARATIEQDFALDRAAPRLCQIIKGVL